jgi:hypothetical protein
LLKKKRWFDKWRKKGLKEAFIGGLGIDPDDDQYRRLSSHPDRDLNPVTHERMLEIAYRLYDRNPLAHRIVELTKDFVIGGGVSYRAENPEVQAILDDFWADPINNWNLKQHDRALELGLFGEQCYPVFVNPYNGRVRLGSLDPARISEVRTNPENAEEVQAIIPKGTGQQPLRIMHQDEEPGSPTFGRLVGDCFYFAINKVSNASRGRSDLLCLADWIDGYEQFLFNRIDRSALISAFVWDVTLEGMSEEEIAGWLKKNPSPKPGSVRAHNEKVRWEAVSPDLKADDAIGEARLLRNFILSGAGFPEHWFSDGSQVNRATAVEMGVPTLKRLSARQRYFRYMIEYIFRFAIDQAIIHGRISQETDARFKVILPELSQLDMEKATGSLERLSKALASAEKRGWITKEMAGKMFIDFSP